VATGRESKESRVVPAKRTMAPALGDFTAERDTRGSRRECVRETVMEGVVRVKGSGEVEEEMIGGLEEGWEDMVGRGLGSCVYGGVGLWGFFPVSLN